MPTIWRYGFTWTGWAGAPGRTVFYGNTGVSTAQVLANDCHTLINNIVNPTGSQPNIIPAGVRIAGDAFADELDSGSGDQVGRLAVTANPPITGTGSGNWAAPAGACITWSTNKFIKGRRLRGRTFFVPLDGVNAFQPDGTLSDSMNTVVAAAIPIFINGQSEPIVWHRPTGPGLTDGDTAPIVTGSMADKVAVLRSRRD